MPYTKQTWADGAAGGTPLTAARLSHIEDGIDAATTAAEAADSVTAASITDATAVGRNVLKAADQAAARTAIGAGTSNLVVGTAATDAKPGNYNPPAATPAANGTVKQSAAQANSTATDVAGLVADLNGLLAKLRTAGILAP
ncbi:head fiber protein [Mycobacteroides abscessus]|uniref:head fiber protein n=1 Tax=Mycobacteroides abscessus TaxID=36809 RepID=UPI0021061DF8|nr:head fiber protein [Mycobacteroides abscessus]